MTSGKKTLWYNQWPIQGSAPLLFGPNWGLKGQKNSFSRPGPLISGSGCLPAPHLSEGLDQTLIMQYMYVCDMDEFYLYSHSIFVGFNLLHETSWLYLFGSTEGSWLVQWLLFFSVLGAWLPQCQSLLFLPVDKKDGFLNDVKHLLKSLCLHRGPLEMYSITSKL